MSITYELAKKLKEAGFPQMSKNESKTCNLKNIASVGIIIENNGEMVYVPILSELIGACGYPFESLARITVEPKQVWRCYSDTDLDYHDGSTPEIAVANLYLALNNKHA